MFTQLLISNLPENIVCHQGDKRGQHRSREDSESEEERRDLGLILIIKRVTYGIHNNGYVATNNWSEFEAVGRAESESSVQETMIDDK